MVRTMTLEVSQLSPCLALLQDRRKERGEHFMQKLYGRNSGQIPPKSMTRKLWEMEGGLDVNEGLR